MTLSKANERLNHIRLNLDRKSDADKYHNAINNDEAHPAARLALADYELAKGLYAWFACRDLKRLQQSFFSSAAVRMTYYKKNKDTSNPISRFYELLMPLISNNTRSIDKYAMYNEVFLTDRINRPQTVDSLSYQSRLALRGDWQELRRRSEAAIQHLEGELTHLRVDYEFYIALSRGDKDGMNRNIVTLTGRDFIKKRRGLENGYTCDIISTPAVIYSKIAWMHGFQIDVDSPFIPSEWLPMTPLSTYELEYEFLKQDRP